ncbi:MAG: hypothetical protein EWM72_01381 [Nitrospira sp.]|nr:MAG: hypothetical protein EWM72_01381 [Nitrospira sp.]
MIFNSILSFLSKTSTRPAWFLLTLWVACWIGPTAGCYQDAPAPTPQATIDLLITLLGDTDASIRLTAAEALGKIGDQKAEQYLLRAIHDVDPTVREAAARSVGQLPAVGVGAGTELVELLRDPDIPVRRAAAQALGAVEGMPTLASALAGLLTSPDPTVRQAAGHALLLVDVDAREAFAALSKGTTDADPAVRQWTVAALGESGDARAVPVLLDRLRHDSVIGVRAEAAYRFRFVGDSSAAVELETIVQQDSSLDVKRWAEKSQLDSGRVSTPIQSLD